VAVIMAYIAEDEMAWGGLPCRGVSIVGEDGAVPNSNGTDMMAERGRGRWPVGNALMLCVVRERELTSGLH
jgi:hypothetical protein